ncbi:hypothetical protein [Mucilaginibacter auburnensis]|uniref:Uncharacterized protein n=1 Tax=Mucilaginibacter auburnensis TaxID=1457233 RepID=A0A2H9VNQ6_9SPHI|nr:hypothetical protein [Mucilaginibacter auburnensis]PJJ79957.1 hypothetical protein CLV57_3096 [Mucilaginibacter auburnensis]
MIEKPISTITGKITLKIPSTLQELTLGQLMAMQEKPELNDLDAISILSGTPTQELQNIKNADDLHVFGEAVLSLANQLKYLYNSDEIPEHVIFHHTTKPLKIKVMHNLSVEPAGAFLASKDIIATEINEHISKHGEENWQESFNPSLNACCKVLANYFYCKVTKDRYDEYKIEEFCETIKQLRVTEALPIAKHFFICYPSLYKRRPGFWHRLLPFWKKKQAYKTLSGLNTSTPLTPSQAAI